MRKVMERERKSHFILVLNFIGRKGNWPFRIKNKRINRDHPQARWIFNGLLGIVFSEGYGNGGALKIIFQFKIYNVFI
jgi:hypothetical protein